MKIFYKTIIVTFLLILSLFCFSSCGSSDEEEDTTGGYVYTPATTDFTEETTTDSSSDLQSAFDKDLSWQKNFDVTYEYFNSEQDENSVRIRERKTEKAFTVEYLDSGELLYYRANGNNTDYYVIVPDESEQLHSVLEGKRFKSLSSMFMKLSNVDESLPKQSNVLYMYDEIVSGRNCHKYIQRAYSEGMLTQSVYVWIDAQYGFAAKCEAYNAEDQLTTMWEIEEFQTDTLKSSDVIIDISDYKFNEEVG